MSGVPSSAISRASSAAWSSPGVPTRACAMLPLTLATARITSRPPKRGVASRSSSASRVPFDAPAGTIARAERAAGERDLGLDGRPAAAVPGRGSAWTVRMRQSASPRVSRRCRRRREEEVSSARRLVVLMVSSVPFARHRPRRRGGRPAAAAAGRRRAASRSRSASSPMYSTGDLPSTRASRSPGSSSGRRGASIAAGGVPNRPHRGRPRRGRRTRRGNAVVAVGVHRHFSSRWLRQNARSNAGSPHHAVSASRNTGPPAPIMMFFGLTSPWTRARWVAAVVATRCSSAGARSGWRRAVARR